MIFLDTSVLVAGLIDFGPASAPSQAVMHAVAERIISPAGTSWHCCLEFYSVATRLPPEFRLSPTDASQLLREEVFGRLAVSDLPAGERADLLKAAVQDGIAGGRIYDTHIAEVARTTGATVIVTDNRRHFLAALRHGIRVETPAEFAASLKSKK
jgi:predicted nucleic acid-binding protein